jgi:hypothetical protein
LGSASHNTVRNHGGVATPGTRTHHFQSGTRHDPLPCLPCAQPPYSTTIYLSHDENPVDVVLGAPKGRDANVFSVLNPSVHVEPGVRIKNLQKYLTISLILKKSFY